MFYLKSKTQTAAPFCIVSMSAPGTNRTAEPGKPPRKPGANRRKTAHKTRR
jgi:hypothetical protein